MTDGSTPQQCVRCRYQLNPPQVGSYASGICTECGATRYRLPTTTGLEAAAGETVTVRMAPITLEPGGANRLARPGLSWLVRQLVFADGDPSTTVELAGKISKEIEHADELLNESARLAEFDGTDPTQHDAIFEKLNNQSSWPEWWAALYGAAGSQFLEMLESRATESREVLVWRLAKIRTMLLFTGHLEEIAWRGYRNYGADTLAGALSEWKTSKYDALEKYWQKFLADRPFLISLISPGPVIVRKGQAYIGGKRLDRTGGNEVDFLLEHSIGGNAGLLEIKRRNTPLLGSPTRGYIYSPSAELSGAVMQILNYRDSLVRKFDLDAPVKTFSPRCTVLIGDYSEQLNSDDRRRSFEMYRSSLNGVSIVTYDEMFKQLEKILEVLRGD